jgi:hypothetical protein
MFTGDILFETGPDTDPETDPDTDFEGVSTAICGISMQVLRRSLKAHNPRIYPRRIAGGNFPSVLWDLSIDSLFTLKFVDICADITD